MIKLDSELSLQILKLSKKFASQHSKHADLYGGFEDYISELNCSIIKKLKSYNENKGAYWTNRNFDFFEVHFEPLYNKNIDNFSIDFYNHNNKNTPEFRLV